MSPCCLYHQIATGLSQLNDNVGSDLRRCTIFFLPVELHAGMLASLDYLTARCPIGSEDPNPNHILLAGLALALHGASLQLCLHIHSVIASITLSLVTVQPLLIQQLGRNLGTFLVPEESLFGGIFAPGAMQCFSLIHDGHSGTHCLDARSESCNSRPNTREAASLYPP